MRRQAGVLRSVLAEMFPSAGRGDRSAGFRDDLLEMMKKDNPARSMESIVVPVDALYLPLFDYISSIMLETELRGKKPVIIGISAPQGAGKTTLTRSLQYLFHLDNKRCEILSLDDFYLTYEDQMKLSKQHPDNPLLQYRGNPGTHDVALLERTLSALNGSWTEPSQVIRIPRYDKSLNHGRGDRAPASNWTIVSETPDVIILEGWMLGFRPIEENNLGNLCPNLKEVNKYLHNYSRVHSLMDSWIVMHAEDIEHVYQWRQEAETLMSMNGKNSMNESQVRDFIDRFMPAYNMYLPFFIKDGPDCSAALLSSSCRVLKVCIGLDRIPYHASFLTHY